jgi:hypothetical protein
MKLSKNLELKMIMGSGLIVSVKRTFLLLLINIGKVTRPLSLSSFVANIFGSLRAVGLRAEGRIIRVRCYQLIEQKRTIGVKKLSYG